MGKRKGKNRQTDGKEKGKAFKDETPDPKSYEFMHDEIDAFHDQREKIMIEKGPLDLKPVDSSSEDEVLGLELDESSDDEDTKIADYKDAIRDIKLEALKYKTRYDVMERDDAEDEGGWGHDKSTFYGRDADDHNKLALYESSDEEDAGAALDEEKEALALQRKMAEQLDDEDFGIDSFIIPLGKDDEVPKILEEEKIVTDLSKLSRRDKLDLLQKEAPEFLQLRDDFIAKMTIIRDLLQPIQDLIVAGELPQGKAANYVDTRIQLYMNYCMNINFYMLLKCKQTSIQSHPVIKRILQYRNIIKQLEKVDVGIEDELKEILDKKAKGHDLGYMTASKKTADRSQKKEKLKKQPTKVSTTAETNQGKGITKKIDQKETDVDKEAARYHSLVHGKSDKWKEEEKEDELLSESELDAEGMDMTDEAFEGKRAITYEMSKNKGLTPKQKKLERNPRAKNREKYRKALVKRRSQIPESKNHFQPYGGELSGIRAAIKKGTKLQ